MKRKIYNYFVDLYLKRL